VRFKLTLEYDGGPFQGWQRLANGASVQGALEDAVEKLTGQRADVVGAGRTDAGVHATGQVAHVDIDKPFAPSRLADALNAHLRPHPVAVLHAEEAAADFHARFSAVRRVYRYCIVNRRAPLALDAGKAWRVPRALDTEVMQAGAARLVGKHDFTTFRDSQCQAKSPIKTLDRCEVVEVQNALCQIKQERPFPHAGKGRVGGESADLYRLGQHPHPRPLPPPGGGEVHILCEAQSFLHRQVRSMVGTLVEAGLGKLSADDVAAALAAKDRARCGPVAPPDGLYLVRVDY
jgi:tRNA pseudouridine38-40 synthase